MCGHLQSEKPQESNRLDCLSHAHVVSKDRIDARTIALCMRVTVPGCACAIWAHPAMKGRGLG